MMTVTISGNVGKDAELKMTPGGQAVCNFNVAVKPKKGETVWFRCAFWGKRGEAVAQYIRKGGRVTVIGELTIGEYNGKPQYDVDAYNVGLGGKSERTDEQPAPQQRRAAPSAQDDFDYGQSPHDPEIPF